MDQSTALFRQAVALHRRPPLKYRRPDEPQHLEATIWLLQMHHAFILKKHMQPKMVRRLAAPPPDSEYSWVDCEEIEWLLPHRGDSPAIAAAARWCVLIRRVWRW